MSLIPKSAQRSAVNGRYRTQQLFTEFGGHLLTLQENDKVLESGKVAQALRPLFVPLVTEDPTEFEFADAVFGSFAYWSRLRESPFMKDHLEEWRYECDVRRKSKAFKAIVQEAESGKAPMQAAKYLVEEPWKVKATTNLTDKRKTRQSIRDTANAAFEAKELQDDLARITKGQVN